MSELIDVVGTEFDIKGGNFFRSQSIGKRNIAADDQTFFRVECDLFVDRVSLGLTLGPDGCLNVRGIFKYS